METLNVEEAKRMVTAMGPSINYDTTREPWFPKLRTDVAVVLRDAEDGCSYGRSVLYIAYNNGHGTKIEKFHDTGNIHDNFHVWSVDIIKGILTVRVGYGGHEPTLKKNLSELGLPA